MSEFGSWQEAVNKQLRPVEILGADVNQSLHHLVGYVWAEGNQNREFPTELFSDLIQFVFDQHREEIDKAQSRIEELEAKVIELDHSSGTWRETAKRLEEQNRELAEALRGFTGDVPKELAKNPTVVAALKYISEKIDKAREVLRKHGLEGEG